MFLTLVSQTSTPGSVTQKKTYSGVAPMSVTLRWQRAYLKEHFCTVRLQHYYGRTLGVPGVHVGLVLPHEVVQLVDVHEAGGGGT